eukprot:721866-Rhodomonas_salina.2
MSEAPALPGTRPICTRGTRYTCTRVPTLYERVCPRCSNFGARLSSKAQQLRYYYYGQIAMLASDLSTPISRHRAG